jgi:hypothetical protein
MRLTRLPTDGIYLSDENIRLLNELPGLTVEADPTPENGLLSFRFNCGERIAYRFTMPQVRRRRGMDDEVPTDPQMQPCPHCYGTITGRLSSSSASLRRIEGSLPVRKFPPEEVDRLE